MSKEQWGHGYHAGMQASKKKKKSKSLIGKFFLSFNEEGKLQYQGMVLSQPQKGYYLIQFFSWLDGCPTDQKLFSLNDMLEWKFYNSDEDMREASYELMNYTTEQIERSEHIIKWMQGK